MSSHQGGVQRRSEADRSTGQVIANLLPGNTLDELHSSFDLSDLGKAQLAKGYILES